MVYASPGTHFNLSSALEKLIGWLQNVAVSHRQSPPSIPLSIAYCSDQWAMCMLLGEWTNGTCQRLSTKYKTYGTSPPRPRGGFEGLHEKIASPPCQVKGKQPWPDYWHRIVE